MMSIQQTGVWFIRQTVVLVAVFWIAFAAGGAAGARSSPWEGEAVSEARPTEAVFEKRRPSRAHEETGGADLPGGPLPDGRGSEGALPDGRGSEGALPDGRGSVQNTASQTRSEPETKEPDVEVSRKVAESGKTLAALTGMVEAARRQGIDVSYFEAVVAAARTGLWRMGPAVRRAAPREILRYGDYITTRCEQARNELAGIMEGKTRAVPVPRPSVLNLRIAGDTFQDEEGNSVLLVGIRNITDEEVPELSRFFNLNAWSWQSAAQLRRDKAYNLCGQVHLFWNQAVEEALKDRPDMRNVGGYSGHNWTKELCVESPTTRRVIAESIARLPMVQRGEDPAYLYALLSAEDRYLCYCDRSVAEFRKWLGEQYHDIKKLNGIWKTDYGAFEGVTPPRLEEGVLVPDNRAAWYDWLRFNRERVTEFYGWLKSQVRRGLPHTPVNGGIYLRLPDSRRGSCGVDVEALNERVNDVMQCETLPFPPTPRPTLKSPPYGLDLCGEASVDLQRSTCGKPATDLEFSPWFYYIRDRLLERGETLPRNYVSAVIYRHFLHGVRAANLWVWNRKESTANDPFALGCSPAIPLESVEECFRAALDVRRLAREIVALSHARSEVAIFFSDATFLQIPPVFIQNWHEPTPCTVELENVYHGSLFLDTPIGFVTERSILRGELAHYKVVLVPGASHVPPRVFQALMAYVEGGGVLVVTPRSFLFDEYNHPHPYLQGMVEIGKTVVRGPLPASGAASLDDPAFLERQVVDPGNAGIPGTPITTTGRGVLRGRTLELEGAGFLQTITAPEAETLATFADGAPAIISLSRGKGRIYYCAIPLRPQSYATLLEAVFAEVGVDRPVRVRDGSGRPLWGVEARTCAYEGDVLMYAINLLSEAVEVRLVGSRPVQGVHDLIANQGLGERFRLAPLQTVILRVKVGPPE